MERIKCLKYLIIGFVVGSFVGLVFSSRLIGRITPKDGYVPSAASLQTMEALNEAGGTYLPNDNLGKVYQVGQTYREGDVAYFSGYSDDYEMQLEEWRLDANKNFNVAIWTFQLNTAKRWSFTVTPNGVVVSPLGKTETLDIRDAEVIAHSVRAQKLILGGEFANSRHLREVVEKDDCVRIAAVRAFEDSRSFIGPLYVNYITLEDGRHVVDRSVFIRKRGESFCRFWTEPVIR